MANDDDADAEGKHDDDDAEDLVADDVFDGVEVPLLLVPLLLLDGWLSKMIISLCKPSFDTLWTYNQD